jgi:ligand-binding sensor domain-containing protein
MPFIYPVNIYSQKQILKFEHLTVDHGLSENAVTCIFQDNQGFMWFGTHDGLNRYDGYSFKVYRQNPLDSTSLSDNIIKSICEDRTIVLPGLCMIRIIPIV